MTKPVIYKVHSCISGLEYVLKTVDNENWLCVCVRVGSLISAATSGEESNTNALIPDQAFLWLNKTIHCQRNSVWTLTVLWFCLTVRFVFF